MSSTLLLGGEAWNLTAPPLSISLQMRTENGDMLVLKNAADINPSPDTWALSYAYGNSTLSYSWIENSTYCQSLNVYQWGCSSLLLFTFCVFSALFAATLAGLQWELFWSSRSDRIKQDFSIYQDILMLSSELRSRFGDHAEDKSVEELKREVKEHPSDLDLAVDELPLSRSQELRRKGRQDPREETQAEGKRAIKLRSTLRGG